jgi:hypothetical protein
MQTAGGEPVGDRLGGESGGEQLRMRNDAVLTTNEGPAGLVNG